MEALKADQHAALQRLKRAIKLAKESGLIQLMYENVGEVVADTFCSAVDEWNPPKLRHLFQFVDVDGGRRINFRRYDTSSHLGRIVDEDLQHILHINNTGNDYCLVECPADEWGAWQKDGQNFVVVSVHGTGEVRWAISPRQVEDFKRHDSNSGLRVDELKQVIEHFEL